MSDPMTALLDEIDQAEYYGVIAPAIAPRDLMAFARAQRLPPGGPHAGQPYDPDTHPAQAALIRAMMSGRYTTFVVIACTQDGKSWVAIQLPLFYVLCELKEACVYGIPDMRLATDSWVEKIRPAMEASPSLATFLPKVGDGSGGGSNVKTVIMNGGGTLIFLGGGGTNKAGQSSRTSRWVLVDEFGKIKPLLTSKFDRRADSFDTEARRVKAGTIENDQGDRLVAEYKLTTQHRMQYPCRGCGVFQPLEWEQVTYDNASDRTARATVRYACKFCQRSWTDEERKEQLLRGVALADGQAIAKDGTITGPEPECETFGILWSALDSPLKSLGTLAVEHRKAVIKDEQGNSHDLIEFWHDQLARVFPVGEGEENMAAQSLAERSALADYDQREVPSAAVYLTAAVDQSLRRYWWMVKAHDMQGRTWRIDWGQAPICAEGEEPSDQQRRDVLVDLLDRIRRGYAKPDTAEVLRPLRIAIDVGAFTAVTRDIIRGMEDVVPVKGTGDTNVKRMGKTGKAKDGQRQPGWYEMREQDKDVGGEWEILFIDSDAVKRQLVRTFLRPVNEPGSSMLPHGLGTEDPLVWHLTCERWEQTEGGAWAWVKHGRRNDWWDTDYYTQALSRFILDVHPHLLQAPLPSSGMRETEDDRGDVDLSWR